MTAAAPHPPVTADYEVFVLSRNRAGLLQEALRSMLAAGCPPERITVSDNSTNESVRELACLFPGITFVYRRPPLPLLDHFNTVIRAARAEYFFLFHDDDLVLKDFLRDALALIQRHPAVGAAAMNAFYLRGDRVTDELCCNLDFQERLLPDGRALLRTFISVHNTNPPFPAIVYRRARVVVSGAVMDHAGKHSDVVFLAMIAQHSGIIQSCRPILAYRQHPEQGSSDLALNRYKDMLNWAERSGMGIAHETSVRLGRLKLHWWLSRRRGWRQRYRFRRAFIALLLRSPMHYPSAIRFVWAKLRPRR